ncbi:hypothetical protein ACLK1T_20565 [Escherichia coli]
MTVNKNSVPNDRAARSVTSGIRVGTPGDYRRGFKEAQRNNWCGCVTRGQHDL